MIDILSFLPLNSNIKINTDYWYLLFFVFSWLISYFSFPTIIKISNDKNLVATPTDRSSHHKKTPTLGGIGIFIGFTLTVTVFGSLFPSTNIFPLLAGIVVLLFLGLKDDIIELSAKVKFSVQFFVITALILITDIRIVSLYGLFDFFEINYFFSIFLTIFVYILLINAYNLIDGVDGLAGTVALIFLSGSSFLFYFSNSTTLCIVSLGLAGSIVAFLKYNFSNKSKIFMGDTGSMIVGFILTYLLICLLNIGEVTFNNLKYKINPLLLLSLLFFPLLDTARVFFVRIVIHRKSPFKADKNHIHHSLLRLGFKHWQIALFVGVTTYILAIFSFYIEKLDIHLQILLVVSFGSFIFSLPQILRKMKVTDFSFLKNNALFLIISLFISLQSCTTKKDLLYFQEGNKNAIDDNRIVGQKIETNDILSIKIFSIDAIAARIYNIDLLEGVGNIVQQPELLKIRGYLVNDDGFITLPVLGQFKATDTTTRELELLLTDRLVNGGHLKDPTVTVRIINSKVTVLGEVRTPGTFVFYEKNLTLLQAIGMAGDLTITGERKDVLLIRYENNTKTIHHINLTSTDWMNSDLFYVKQNDVIVVNPNTAKVKSAGIIGNAGTLISVISLLLTGILLINR